MGWPWATPQFGHPSPCPCMAAGQGAVMQGDSGVPWRGGIQAGVKAVVGGVLKEGLGGAVPGPQCCSSALFQHMLGMLT